MTVSDQLRKAIRDTGLSGAKLSKSLEMSDTTITRFLAGKQLQSDKVDELCERLGLELRPVESRKRKPS